MIMIFKNTRKKFLREGKTVNYLKYALGEIVLVVIGILIALQINNWNTSKNNQSFEFKMLKEIQGALNDDYIFFDKHLLGYRNKTEIDAVAFFDKAIISKKVVEDSVDYYFNRLDYGLEITYNRGPYDALKASGIEKITNDSLRNKLIYFYDFYLPRNQKLVEWFMNFNRAKMAPLIQKLSVPAPIIIKGDSIIRKGRSMNKIDFEKNNDFNALLYSAGENSQTIKKILVEMTSAIQELTELLDNEIEKELKNRQ